MDTTDRRIIARLERDARLAYADIAKDLGLAASSVYDRVQRLQQAGVIRAYRAEIDLEGVGLPITAFVDLQLRTGSPPDIPARVEAFPSIESCYSIAGDHSYRLVVRATSTKALEQVLDELRNTLEVDTRTTVVLSIYFERRPIVELNDSGGSPSLDPVDGRLRGQRRRATRTRASRGQ